MTKKNYYGWEKRDFDMSGIKIEDDYLPSSEFGLVQNLYAPAEPSNQIQSQIGAIPWVMAEVVNFRASGHPELENVEKENLDDNFQLSYVLYESPNARIGSEPIVSSQNKFLFPIFFQKINPRGLLKVKTNLLMRTNEIIKHGFHCDYPADIYAGLTTSIFYINSNDGYTEFEDGTKIESVGNRLVTFPYHMKHRGTTCTNKPFRIVINFNYF